MWRDEAAVQAALLWPAPTTLAAPLTVDSVSCWLWIQGRQDRVHGLVDAEQATHVDPRVLGVNWAWSVVADPATSIPAGWGGVLVAPGAWRVLRPAPAIPGIFLRRHADTFRAWKALSDF